MGYSLGVDLGTTYTAAAICRDGEVTMATLGAAAPEMPTVVAVGDGGPVAGESAERRSVTEPDRIAREFKRRVGDPVPIVVGGEAWSAESLMAVVLGDVVHRVSEAEGASPEELVVTVPASWGSYKLDTFAGALAAAGWSEARRLTEPEAAARWYLGQDKLEPGAVVAVFDFGGGTFDSAILRHHDDDRFERLGEAIGIERLGGVDLDEAVFRRVIADAGLDLTELADDQANRSALARLRADCTAAKEALSADTSTTIVVMIPGHHSELRLTRQEFESMIRPAIADAIGAMDATIRSAGLGSGDLDAVLLVGGSSRIPLVAQMVSAHFDCPTLIDTHPKHTIASGAALPTRVSAPARDGSEESPPPEPPPSPEPEAETVEPVAESPAGRRTPRLVAVFLALAAVIAIGSTIALLARDSDDEVSAEGADAQAVPSSGAEMENDVGDEPPGSPSPASQPGGDFTILLGTDSRSEAPAGIATHELGFTSDGPPGDPSLLWTLQPDNGLWSSVVGGSGLVFVLEDRPAGMTLKTYDGRTGSEKWASLVPWAYDIFVAGPTVMVVSPDGVEAFDQQSGLPLGSVGPAVDASPQTSLIRGPVALFSTSTDSANGQANQVRSIDLATNEVNWVWEEEFRYPLPMVTFLADESTAIVGGTREIVALDVESGAELWRTEELDGYGLELIADGVLVASADGNLTGLDARTGAQLWTRPDLAFRLASDGDAAFFMNRAGELEAVALETGATAWAVAPSPVVDQDTSIVVGNETVYVLQGDGVVTAHRAATGAVEWSGTLDGLSSDTSGPMTVAIADERLIVVRHSKVHVFGADDNAGIGPAGTDGDGVRSAFASILDLEVSIASAHPSFTNGGRPFVEPGPLDEPSVLWQVNRVQDRTPAVAAAGLVLYVDSFPDPNADSVLKTHVVAADAKTGVERWATPITGSVFQLHVLGPTLVARTVRGLTGIDIATGEVIAAVDVEGPPLADHLHVRDGSLIIGWVGPGGKNLVESIDIESGATDWTFLDDTSGGTARQLLVGDDTVILVLDDSTVAIDRSSGDELWRTLEFGGGAVEFLTGNTLLVHLVLTGTVAIDARSGETAWETGESGFGSADDGSFFYAVSYDYQRLSDRLVSVDLRDGTRRWSAATETESRPWPLISGDVVYLIDDDGTLEAHRTSDGDRLWSTASGVTSRTGLFAAVGSDVIVFTDSRRIAVVG